VSYAKSATSSEPESFELPFGGKLSDENRWVIMANLIPWENFEAEYAKSFSKKKVRPPYHLGWHWEH
jgi:transposase, IS5 family